MSSSFCFLLELFIDQLMMCLLDNLKASAWGMIFLFYSNFSLNDSLENTVYEYLKWLKFQAFSEVSFPELLQGGGEVTAPPDPPALLHTVYGSAK